MLSAKKYEQLPDEPKPPYTTTSEIVVAEAKSGTPLGLGVADLPAAYGRHVLSVVDEKGRGGAAGFMKGDVLVSLGAAWGGESFAELTHKQLMLKLAKTGGSGKSFTVIVGRSGNPTHATTLTVTIGSRRRGTPLGIGVADNTWQRVAATGTKVCNHKLSIVKKSSPFKSAGCKLNDAIVAISGTNVQHKAHSDVMGMLNTLAQSGAAFDITVGRGVVSCERAANVVTPGRERPKLGNYAMPATPGNVWLSPAPENSPGLWNESPKGFTPKKIGHARAGYLTVHYSPGV